MQGIFVARQPIFDRKHNVFAYELLFRNSEQNFAQIDIPDRATSELIINALTELGLENLIDDKKGFINLTRNFVTGSLPIPAAQDRLVLEVLEDIELDDKVLDGIQRLKQQQYIIALDDFIFHPHLKPLVEIADIIKIDLMALTTEQLEQHVEQLKQYPVKLLAEKVETAEEYERCLELGFGYFQGYFFSRPHIISGKRIPSNRMAILNLLGRLSDPETDMDAIEKLIASDVTLSYRILRYMNSAVFELDHPVESIRSAIMLLGVETVRSIACLIMLTNADDKPFELFVTALIRGYICQLTAVQLGHEKQAARYFMVGLFSVMDAIMDQPMQDVLQQLPLADSVKHAILKHEGSMGQILLATTAFQEGRWDRIINDENFEISMQQLAANYLEALSWSKTFQQLLGRQAAA